MPATEEFNVLTHFLEQWDWVIDAVRHTHILLERCLISKAVSKLPQVCPY